MDRVEKYRQIVRDVLESFIDEYDKDAQVVFDCDHDRYLVIHNEWKGYDRFYGCVMHLDVIDNQIWIQQNNTEIYIDKELVQKGVEPKDVILGFRAPAVRRLIAASLEN